MHLTVSEAGAVLLLAFAVFDLMGVLAKTRVVAAFLGVVLTGTAGFAGRILTDLGTWGQNIFAEVMHWAVGVSLTFGLFLLLGFLVVHDMHPKKGAKRHTGWAALLLGALVVAGVQGIPALAGLRDSIVNGASSALSVL